MAAVPVDTLNRRVDTRSLLERIDLDTLRVAVSPLPSQIALGAGGHPPGGRGQHLLDGYT